MTLVRLAPQHTAPAGVAVFIDPDAPFGGACRDHDPETWWPISAKSLTTITVAKQICRACPVLDACRDWAERTPGQWAGAVIAGVYRDSGGYPVTTREVAPAKPARPVVVVEHNPEADEVLVPAVVRRRKPRKQGRPVEPIHHGTEGGASKHRRQGEQPCEACLVARRLASQMRSQRKALQAIAS